MTGITQGGTLLHAALTRVAGRKVRVLGRQSGKALLRAAQSR